MVKLVELIKKLSKYGISDIHFHESKLPYVRKLTKIIRLDNEEIITKTDFEEFFTYLSVSREKLEELKKYGAFDLGMKIDEIGNFRLNIYKQLGKYACSVRLLPSKIPSFSELNISNNLLRITNMVSGLVLITGLTGNGKSTTIASLIDLINQTKEKHIITIEDPIEYHYTEQKSLISQREIGNDCDSFATGLREALRQDPDVIVIGEMRDKETILTAIEAAESGHLVLSTLHTGSASSAVDRIISYFSDEEKNHICSKLSMILSLVVSQKLILNIDHTKVYPAQEIMFMNDSIRNLIREGKYYQIYSFIQISKDNGSITLEENLAQLVNSKKITIDSAFENCNNQKALDGYLRQLHIIK